MAAGGILGTTLAAVKSHAAAATIVGVVLVSGGATATAVATGAIHFTGQSSAQGGQNNQGNDQNDERAKACAHNGEAKRLAATYAAMFDDSDQKAQDSICALFASKNGGHDIGFGEIRQALNIAATIESKGGSKDCLKATPVPGDAGDASKLGTALTPSDSGKSTDSGNLGIVTVHQSATLATPSATPATPSATLATPSASANDTNALLKSVLDARDHGTPLAQLARSCGVPHASDGAGQD